MENSIFSIDKDKIIEELTCPICLDIFDEPILEFPNQHIFCKKCLIKSNIHNKTLFCPLCKNPIEKTIKPRFINNMLSIIEMKCLSKYNNEECHWKGNAIDYHQHKRCCEILKKEQEESLLKISKQMKQIFAKEINPHLKKEHLEIYNNYVHEWNWLINTNKDWKWWWWSNNKWWNNKVCEECNILWHKYEDEVQVFENQRISILNSFN